MAVNMSLELGPIVGEFGGSNKPVVPIEIEDFSYGGQANMSGGQRAGRTRYTDITITKYVDKSTPNIIRYLDRNMLIKSAKIIVKKQGGDQRIFYTLELFDVTVSSFNSLGQGVGQKAPSETSGKNSADMIQEHFTLNYARMNVIYAAQKEKGQMSGDVIVNIDLRGVS